MRVSRYVNLTPYCIAEYMFDPLGSIDFYQDDFVLLKNSTLNIHQIFNDDASYSSTRNIKDLTVTPIGNNTYVYLDSEKIPDYATYDSNIELSPITSYNVAMDKVRFHFVSGFDFDKFKALILSVKHDENNGVNNLFANILLAPETIGELIIFNAKPLFLGNALFDRYIDILVPSIKNINEDYRNAPVQASTFAAAITPNDTSYTGFIYNNQISIGLSECERRKKIYTDTQVTYDAFEVTEYFEAQLSQTNEFDTVGAYVNEATDGDYIEFYLTYNSGFPSDMLSILNARNPSDDWIIVHQLSVFEQVGSAFLNTARLVFFQEDKFDEPNVFRPVLKNANEAVSMSIDYVARLTNRTNGEQIIREASYSLISPKKYGKSLNKIQLFDAPQSHKIYNKILKKNFESTKLFIDQSLAESTDLSTDITALQTTTITKVEYVPIFFNNNSISVANPSSLIKITDTQEEVIFGPGKLRFILSPFDNVIKLKVYTSNSSSSKYTPAPLDLNVSSAKYRLVFHTDSGKMSIDNANDANQENLSTGVIVFNVSKKDSEAISNSTKRTVYLVSVSQDGRETLIYSGEWRHPSEQFEVDSMIASIKEEYASQSKVQSALDNVSDKITKADSKSATTAINKRSPIKDKAVPSIVNKFGMTKSKSLIPSVKTAGSDIKTTTKK